MSVLEAFKKWYKDHTGHPANIKFAKEAIDELEQDNEDLKHRVKDLSACVEVSVSRNNDLKKENAELRAMLKVAVDDVDCYGEFTSYNHKKAKELLNK